MRLSRAERNFNGFIEGLDRSIQQAINENLQGEPLKNRIVELLMQCLGGLIIYIPNGKKTNKNARHKLIKMEFNGNNHRELAKKYGVSLSWVYQILRDKE